MRGKARSAVLWGIAVTCGILAAVALAQETVRPDWLDLDYGVRYLMLRQRLTAEPHRPLWLFLGTSRTAIGVRPALWTTHERLVFNFGIGGAKPISQLLTLERLHRSGVRPARVFVELLPSVFFMHQTAESALNIDTLSWADFLALRGYWADRRSAVRHILKSRLSSVSAAREALMLADSAGIPHLQARADWQHLDEFGWTKLPPSYFEPSIRVLLWQQVQRDFAHTIGRECEICEIQVRAIRAILDRCRDRDIEAVLYTMPESAELRAIAYPKQGQERFALMVRQLQEEYAVPFVDTRDWLTWDDFIDGHHMTTEAAAKFSERFAKEMR